MKFLTFNTRQEFYNSLQGADLINDELGIIAKLNEPLPEGLIPENYHWVPFYDSHTCDEHLLRLLTKNKVLTKELAQVKARLLALLTNQEPT